MVRSRMELFETTAVLGDLVRLRYVHNSGAAFSLFQGNRYLFIAISLVAIAAVIWLVVRRYYTFRGSQIAFGMVLGGAIGNLIDRIWLAEVIDFIDIGVVSYRWPTFNVADIGVTLGVLYLAAHFLFTATGEGAAGEAADGASDV